MGSPLTSPRAASIVPGADDGMPEARAWWFHSFPLALDDPLATLPKAALEEGKWKPFSKRDCEALEVAWDRLPDHIKRREERVPDEHGVVNELGIQKETEKDNDGEVEDVSQDDSKVIVGVERLYHVDLVTRMYSPVPNPSL
jgi:hypothetical protein